MLRLQENKTRHPILSLTTFAGTWWTCYGRARSPWRDRPGSAVFHGRRSGSGVPQRASMRRASGAHKAPVLHEDAGACSRARSALKQAPTAQTGRQGAHRMAAEDAARRSPMKPHATPACANWPVFMEMEKESEFIGTCFLSLSNNFLHSLPLD